MKDISLVQEFYNENNRFPNDEETFELIDDMVDDLRDKRFMTQVSEMFDKEYPGRVHCAWMIGSLSDKWDNPVIVHSSDIVDIRDQLFLGHKIYELAGMKTDICTLSLVKVINDPVVMSSAEKHTPVLFYKCDSARIPEIHKTRFSDDIPEDLNELLKMMLPDDPEAQPTELDKALDSMKNDFFMANGFIPSEEECVLMVDDARKEIRKEKQLEERFRKEYKEKSNIKTALTDKTDEEKGMTYITGDYINDMGLMNYTYYCVIKLKKHVALEDVVEIMDIADQAFSNSFGVIRNISEYSHRFIYCSNLDNLSCLELGMSKLLKDDYFLTDVRSVQLIDTEESANDIERLDTLRKYIEIFD